MRSKAGMIAATALLITMAGCAPVDPGFGEAVRYDMAVQTIDPDPVHPEDAAKPGEHGELGQKATERYRKGTTKTLRRESSRAGN